MIPQTTAPDPARGAAGWRAETFRCADGTALALFRAGRTEPDAPAYVLLHGMGHWTQAAWDAVAARLAATHRIVAFDLPGFGDSEKPDVAYTLAYFTAVLGEIVAAQGAAPVALAGHSLGGLIAANYAAHCPERVRALALVDPAGFVRTSRLVLRIAGSRPLIALMRAIRPSRGFVRRTFAGAVADPTVIPEAYHARAFALSQDRAVTRAFASVYASAMHELLHMRRLHARLAAYRGPVALVWGHEDRYVPIAGLAAARTVYPQASVLAIPACGHCPPLEFPALTAERLASLAP